jgi:undecaprenyl-diphosphatase
VDPGSLTRTSRLGRWRRFLSYDEAVLLRLTRWQGRRSTVIMQGFTRLADGDTLLFLALFLAATGPTGLAATMQMGTGGLLAAGLAQVLKRLLRRDRPDRRIEGFRAVETNPDAFSFPSGHTATAFGIAVAFGHPVGSPAMLVVASAVGFSRVCLGAHYPLDVTVGAALGLASGMLAQTWNVP